MGGKRGKMAIVRECWTRQWTKEATLPEVIHCKIVLSSQRMLSHAKLGSPTTNLISEVYVNDTMATMMSIDIVVDLEHNCISSKIQ